ncbi:MAG TPA: DUF1674 domain-containing protein [Magnetospirillum sp.]|nr:DUF1674 domain-containing protein [Magnetospirillum sp.]
MSDEPKTQTAPDQGAEPAKPMPAQKPPVEEIGGPEGAEPTRFGDWEKAGRCSDF